MKRTLSIILSVLMLCSVFTNLGITASAAETTVNQSGNGVTYTLDTTAGTLVIHGSGPMTDYAYAFATPWAYQKSYVKTLIIEEGVTHIGKYAFYSFPNLTSVTIPDSVTSIGSMAFDYCTSLPSIEIPDSVTTLGENAFSNCTKATTLTVGNGVTVIPTNCFYNSNGLTTATLGNNVKEIGKSAFYNCKSLASISLPQSLTIIGNNAFEGCSALTSMTLPNSLTTIGNNAFMNCSSFKSHTIPASVTSIGDMAFRNNSALTSFTVDSNNPSYCSVNGVLFNKDCTNLIQYPLGKTATSYTIPSTVKTISPYAFYMNKSLTGITIPSSVTSIGEYSFYYCQGLKTLTIPGSVKTIKAQAFYNCSALTSLTIGNGTETIEYNAFAYCSNLTKISLPDSLTAMDSSVFSNTGYYKNTANWASNVLYIGKHLIKADAAISGAYTVKSGTVSIANSAFTYCTSLTGITIPDSVTYLGLSAFEGCTKLASVSLSKNIKEIQSNTFYNCSKITSITLPANVTTIGYSAFEGCTGLTSITIPDAVTTINRFAFESCSKLTAVYTNSVENWCNISFENYSANPLYFAHNLYVNNKLITTLTIPEGVTAVNAYSFINATSLTTVEVPATVTSIEQSAFEDCSALTAVHTNSIENWCNIFFSNNTANPLYYAKNLYVNNELLTTLTIPEGITAVNAYSFINSSSLTTVDVPVAVTNIGQSAFEGCTKLNKVTIRNKNCEIYNSASTINNTAVIYGISGSTAKAYATTYGRSFVSMDYDYVVNNDGTATIIKYKGTGLEANIPATIDGYTVTAIAPYVFNECTNLRSIIIPDTVETIGAYAFLNCASVATVQLGNGIKAIGEGAFSGCSDITDLYIKDIGAWCNIDFDGLASNPLYYARYLYLDIDLITDLVIPEGVTSISDYAFWNCPSITTVTIPDTVTEIGSYAFYNCNGIQSVYINSIENWCNITFGNYYANPVYYAGALYVNDEILSTLAIPEDITTVNDFAFINCNTLTSVTVPSTVTNIGDDAFYGCTSLMDVYTDSIESWCNISFENSTANPLYYSGALYVNGELASKIEIPATVTNINDYAFFHCTTLTDVIIPNTVTNIGDYAFHNCSATFYGYTETAAEEYATTNGMTFVAYGDINGDGEVSITDVTTIQKHLVKLIKLDESQLKKADLSGDGKLSIRDATYIQMYIAKLIDTFPAYK